MNKWEHRQCFAQVEMVESILIDKNRIINSLKLNGNEYIFEEVGNQTLLIIDLSSWITGVIPNAELAPTKS